MKEREEAKRARGELPEPKPKDKVPKKRGRKPKIDWDSMSAEVSQIHRGISDRVVSRIVII